MNDFSSLSPLLILIGGALVILLLEAFGRWSSRLIHFILALGSLLSSLVMALTFWGKKVTYFSGAYILDDMAILMIVLFCLAGVLIIFISLTYMIEHGFNRGEYLALLLLATTGLIIMTSSVDLIVIFLGLETLSLASYVLAGLKKEDEKSSEAAIKYFLLGSLASAFLVLGLAFIFIQSQSFNLKEIISNISKGADNSIIFLIGLSLIIVGFGFKVALVPFHMWTPDVYQGAPTPITAFFSVAPKAAGFFVLFRLVSPFFEPIYLRQNLKIILFLLSSLTMIVANLVALRQRNVKRLLAYSSIAHAGYLSLALLSQDASGLIFYLIAYLFMNIGAFAILIALSPNGREFHDLDDFNGLASRAPWLAACMSVFLISLAGFPPTAGFLAKFYIFSNAIKQGYVVLVIIAVLTSLISVYYYLRVIVHMYMSKELPPQAIRINSDFLLLLIIFFCVYAVLQLGLFPGQVINFIQRASSSSPFL
ncbi:MAG: NADH-quinone oxidoreductase subunit N [Candidatus Aminicenantes bacterium]|nr:NADH-quinone oxidoreductase subunit N [Candidatus Aminicenantes bacterium]